MNQRRRLHRAKTEQIRMIEKMDPLRFALGMVWEYEQRLARVKSDEHKKKLLKKVNIWKRKIQELKHSLPPGT